MSKQQLKQGREEATFRVSSQQNDANIYQSVYTKEKRQADSMDDTLTERKRLTNPLIATYGGSDDDLKRYTLVLPGELFDEVRRIAKERQTTVVDLFRRFIRLGLLAVYLQDQPDAALIIKEGENEQRLVLW